MQAWTLNSLCLSELGIILATNVWFTFLTKDFVKYVCSLLKMGFLWYLSIRFVFGFYQFKIWITTLKRYFFIINFLVCYQNLNWCYGIPICHWFCWDIQPAILHIYRLPSFLFWVTNTFIFNINIKHQL